MLLPTPAPVTLHPPTAITPAPLVTPAALPTRSPGESVYVDGQGIIRSIYYAGRSIVVACAPNSTCRVELQAGSDILSNLLPPTGWHLTPDNTGVVPMVLIVPDANAPDTGVVVQTKSRSYAMVLHVDPSARNATYGYLFPDAHGHVTLPDDKPYTVSSDEDETQAIYDAPLAPAPCPKSYNVVSQNDPQFWPHMVYLEDGGVSIAFPAIGVIPVAAVPLSGQEKAPLDLSRLAMIAQSGQINGTDRIVHVLSCYPTIVLYLGFGRDRRAVILEAQQEPHP